jgi:hypothetical protein
MSVLVPMPVKPGLNMRILNKMYSNLYRLMNLEGFEIAFDYARYPKHHDDENFFARLARMRQQMIEDFLRPHHTDVLWIDADVLEWPGDLYTMLRNVSSGVVAPLVLIEDSPINYDTAGMRQSFEHRSGMDKPYFTGDGPVYDMESVGGCVLVPAKVHRGVAFEAQDDKDENWVTEWWSVCQGAKKMGYEVKCTTEIIVRHANLPQYGEAYH